MRRLLPMFTLCLALLLGTPVLAWNWEAGTRLTLVTGDGARVLGVGEVDEGGLGLRLASDYSGFAVLIVEAPDGRLEAFDVVVEADGDILFGEEGHFLDFAESLARSGLELDLLILTADGGEPDDAVLGDGGSPAGGESTPAGGVAGSVDALPVSLPEATDVVPELGSGAPGEEVPPEEEGRGRPQEGAGPGPAPGDGPPDGGPGEAGNPGLGAPAGVGDSEGGPPEGVGGPDGGPPDGAADPESSPPDGVGGPEYVPPTGMDDPE